MLTGDRAKYLGLIFAIAFSSFLIAQQASLVTGVMNRTRSQILDVTAADLWVMDPATAYIDEIYSLKDSDVDRVRSISGVRWAVLFFKGQSRTIASDGKFRQTLLLGLDDASLAGARLAQSQITITTDLVAYTKLSAGGVHFAPSPQNSVTCFLLQAG